MQLEPADQTQLGRAGAVLGVEAALGDRVWDRQHRFRIWIGPLTLEDYVGFLPGAAALRQLVAWVRFYFCFELDWDVRLVIERRARPELRLGSGPRLGWTTWAGERPDRDADDLCLDAEAFVDRVGDHAA